MPKNRRFGVYDLALSIIQHFKHWRHFLKKTLFFRRFVVSRPIFDFLHKFKANSVSPQIRNFSNFWHILSGSVYISRKPTRGSPVCFKGLWVMSMHYIFYTALHCVTCFYFVLQGYQALCYNVCKHRLVRWYISVKMIYVKSSKIEREKTKQRQKELSVPEVSENRQCNSTHKRRTVGFSTDIKIFITIHFVSKNAKICVNCLLYNVFLFISIWTQQFFYKYFSSMMYIFSKSHLLPHLMLLCEEISLVWLARQGHMTRKRLCKGMPAEKRLLGCGKNKSYKKKNCCRKTDIPGWKG